MRVSGKHLLGLAVETRSGQHLGKVQDFTVDVDAQTILQYTVRQSALLEGLFGKTLLVGADQVVSVTNEKLVVDDLVVRDAARAKAAATPEAAPNA